MIEVDTAHFKGNYPDSCALEAVDAPAGARITDLIGSSTVWHTLVPELKLDADARHFFDVSRAPPPTPITHVRLSIFPDGGISRLRVWGRHGG